MVQPLRLFVRVVALAAGSCILAVALIPLGSWLIGYRVNADSGELAIEAAKIGNPKLCASIFNYDFLGLLRGNLGHIVSIVMPKSPKIQKPANS